MSRLVTATEAYNTFEILLWAVFGIDCVRRAVNGSARRIPASVAAVTFFVFAASEAVEIRTGAWWQPWWLFVWKAACVLTLVGLVVESWRRRLRLRIETVDERQDIVARDAP